MSTRTGSFTTTNIRLPVWMLKTLKHEAVERNKSVAQLIRESIEKTFAITKRRKINERIFGR